VKLLPDFSPHRHPVRAAIAASAAVGIPAFVVIYRSFGWKWPAAAAMVAAVFALIGPVGVLMARYPERFEREMERERRRRRERSLSLAEFMLLGLGGFTVAVGISRGNGGLIAAGAPVIALALMFLLIRRNAPR
jgi:hypothetical protein